MDNEIAINTTCPECRSEIKGFLTNKDTGSVILRCWLCDHKWDMKVEDLQKKTDE